MYTINLILRRNAQKKNGEYPVNIRLKIDSVIKIYATKIAVLEENWDDLRYVVNKADPLHFTKNAVLSDLYPKAEKIALRLDIDGLLSFEEFEKDFFDTKEKQDDTSKKTCYYQYAKKFIDLNKLKWVPQHVRMYQSELTKLSNFREQVFIEDMNVEFLAQYDKYMRGELNNVTNTVHKTFKFMKVILKNAVVDGVIEKTPFEKYSVTRTPTHREYLTKEELMRLEKLIEDDAFNQNNRAMNVLLYFLFACYTGVRYSDLASLTHANVVLGNKPHLTFTMHKTKHQINQPLSKRALSLIPNLNCGVPSLPLFRVLTNQKTNEYLKAIAVAAKINKTVSSHVARHSFATISLSELDIPIAVVSKLLGHTDIKTTEIYAKIMDKKKFEEMDKWNSL